MSTQHNAFVRGVRYLCYLLAVVGLLALMTVSTLTVIDAVLRRYFASSIDGLSDVLEWCIVVAVSACFPAMLWRKNAITVRVLGTILPWRARSARPPGRFAAARGDCHRRLATRPLHPRRLALR